MIYIITGKSYNDYFRIMIECIFTKFLFFTDEKKDYLKSALSIDV